MNLHSNHHQQLQASSSQHFAMRTVLHHVYALAAFISSHITDVSGSPAVCSSLPATTQRRHLRVKALEGFIIYEDCFFDSNIQKHSLRRGRFVRAQWSQLRHTIFCLESSALKRTLFPLAATSRRCRLFPPCSFFARGRVTSALSYSALFLLSVSC